MKKKIENLDITPKNTKQEIIEAYQMALGELEAIKTQDPREEKKTQEKATLVQTASDQSISSVIQNVSNLKLSLTQALDKISTNLIDEVKKFQDLQSEGRH